MNKQHEIAGLDNARDIMLANVTPRYLELQKLEDYVAGEQYRDRKSFWAQDVPMQERAPAIVHRLVKSAIGSNVDLVFGEGRFPSVRDVDATETSKQIAAAIDDARFKSHCRNVLAHAMGCRSGVGLYGLRNGRLFAETCKAKWCEQPQFDVDGNVERLEIRYPYIETVKEHGRWVAKVKLFRRVIDASYDVTFAPAQARDDGVEPNWTVKHKIAHGLGFCPVVWYPFLRGATTVADFDGKAIHDGLLDQLEAHDWALSQRHRAAMFLGEPQIVEIGVERGYCPTEKGRAPAIKATPQGGKPSATNPADGEYRVYGSGGGDGKRKKGPGYVWQYESDKTKVEILELSAGALTALDEHAHDLRQKLAEDLCVVFLDPENIKFAATTSGKSLETLKARQLDRCDQIRDDVEANLLTPALSMLLELDARRGAAAA